MSQYILKLARADVARPWGRWTKICIIGSISSLAYIEFIGRASFQPAQYDAVGWGVLFAVGLLLGSVVAGILALTRHGNSKLVPLLALCVTAGLGWPFIEIGLVEIPTLILLRVLSLPRLVLVGGLLFGVGLLVRWLSRT